MSKAYAEMNLILSRLIWNFDLTIVAGQDGWIHQTASMVWEKKPLMVLVRDRAGLRDVE